MIDRISMEDGIVPDFPLLEDEDNRVINRYGLLNANDYRGRKIPHPTIYVVDKDGVITYRFVETNYRVRASNGDILNALADLN